MENELLAWITMIAWGTVGVLCKIGGLKLGLFKGVSDGE